MLKPSIKAAYDRHLAPIEHRMAAGGLDLASAYREHGPAILAYLRRRTGNSAQAEDLTQEVFLAALVAQPSLSKADKPLLAWLYTVARRRAIDAARGTRREAQLAPEYAQARTWLDDGRVRTAAITEGIRALPAEQQRVALLRLVSGRSFAEIGAAVGADAAVCRVRFSRALRTLRRSLDQLTVMLVTVLVDSSADWFDRVCGCV